MFEQSLCGAMQPGTLRGMDKHARTLNDTDYEDVQKMLTAGSAVVLEKQTSLEGKVRQKIALRTDAGYRLDLWEQQPDGHWDVKSLVVPDDTPGLLASLKTS